MKSEVIRVLPQLENEKEDAPVVPHLCFYCSTAHEVLLCNWCRQIYYCRKHQSIHRSRSKCFPFIVSRGCGGLRGRRLLASRDIKPGKCKKSPNHTTLCDFTENVDNFEARTERVNFGLFESNSDFT